MWKAAADWKARLTTFYREPQRKLSEAFAGSGFWRLFALGTVPLWLTPELYHEHLRASKARSGRSALWMAAALWFGAMTLMVLPVISVAEAAVKRLGTSLGYWDDLFTSPASKLLLMALSWLIFFVLATLEWSLTWIACLIDSAFGGRTISPPSFGYFAIKIAGEIASVAALISALIFSAKPLNTPIWVWLSAPGLLQLAVIISIATAIIFGSDLKIRTARKSAREIYGNPRKAVGYPLGLCIIMLITLWLLAKRHGS